MKLTDLKIGIVKQNTEFTWLGLTAEEYAGKRVLTYLNDIKYLEELRKNNTIVGVITTNEIAKKIEDNKYGILIVDNPKETFFNIHNYLIKEEFYFQKKTNIISKSAIISESVILEKENIIIEDGVILEENVIIRANTIIKKGSRIGAGTIIGSLPLEIYKKNNENTQVFPAGNVVIEENVNIQSNSTVEKGVFGSTYIEKNVQIDDLVQIGHDSRIGKNTIVTAGTIIGGRTKVGKNSYIGLNASIRNGLKLGENIKVSMGAVVTKDIENNECVTGNFAIPHNKFIKLFKYLLKLIGD